MLPSPTPLVRLLSMEEVIGSSASKQSLMERPPQQLRVEPQAESTSRFEATPSFTSSRRVFIKGRLVALFSFCLSVFLCDSTGKRGGRGRRKRAENHRSRSGRMSPSSLRSRFGFVGFSALRSEHPFMINY